jgi:hypothetical protein
LQALASPGVNLEADSLFPSAQPPHKQQTRSRSPTSVNRYPTDERDPNLWVPNKLHKERMKNAHPTTQAQGEQVSLMQPQANISQRPFYPTLQQWSSVGCPVDCGPDWKWETIEEAVRRGPHKSAMDPESLLTAQEDIAYQVQAGFCQIYPWEELQRLRPAQLKISPMAVIPQKNRRGAGESYLISLSQCTSPAPHADRGARIRPASTARQQSWRRKAR